MKPIWKITIWILLIVGIPAIILIVPHYRARAAVRNFRKQLIAQGEKLTYAELIPQLPDDNSNASHDFIAAASLLNYLTNAPSMMHNLGHGHALVSWMETNSVTEDQTNGWPSLAETVHQHEAALNSLRLALQKPALAFPVEYRQGYSSLVTHLGPERMTSAWLASAVALHLHNNDASHAWENLRAEVNLLRLNHGEPLMISQMIRSSMVQNGTGAIWEALQYPGWSDQQLLELQTSMDSFNLFDQTEACFAMHRAMNETEFTVTRQAFTNYISLVHSRSVVTEYDSFGQALTHPMQGIPTFLGRHPRFWMWKWWGSYDEEVYSLQVWQMGLAAIRSARKADSAFPALKDYDQFLTNLHKIHPGWDRRFLFGDDVANNNKSFLTRMATAESARRVVVTAIALKRFQQQHSNYPTALPELVPNYLAKVPIDFMDGKPLRYQRRDDSTFLLYSIGGDGRDDGGDATSTLPENTKNKFWLRGRDVVWPTPATPDEVRTYENDLLTKYNARTQQKKVVPRPVKPISTSVPQ